MNNLTKSLEALSIHNQLSNAQHNALKNALEKTYKQLSVCVQTVDMSVVERGLDLVVSSIRETLSEVEEVGEDSVTADDEEDQESERIRKLNLFRS